MREAPVYPDGKVPMPVQLGGGIRDLKTVEAWLAKGIARVIIGTAAVRDPALVKEAAKKFPNRVAVGLDAKDGKVAVEGWAETSELTVLDIAKRFEDAGVAAIIYTDVARDGMLKGINWDATIGLADAISIPVIASGGLASIDDIKVMTEPRAKKLEGAIAGRALYDGRLDAREALAMDPSGIMRGADGFFWLSGPTMVRLTSKVPVAPFAKRQSIEAKSSFSTSPLGSSGRPRP